MPLPAVGAASQLGWPGALAERPTRSALTRHSRAVVSVSYEDLLDFFDSRFVKYCPVRPSAAEALARYTGGSAPRSGFLMNGRTTLTNGANARDGSSALKAVGIMAGSSAVAVTPVPANRRASS